MIVRRTAHTSAASKFFRCFFDLQHAPATIHHNAPVCPRQTASETRPYTTKSLTRPLSGRRGQPKSPLGCRHEHTGVSATSTTPSTSSSQPPQPEETLSTHLRHLMRLVPHPVTLITSSQPPASPHDQPPPESLFRGATVSSLNTVTLTPTPLISLNIRLPSSTYTAMQASSTFLAHVLAANSAGARIADAFARGDAAIAFTKLVDVDSNPNNDPASTKSISENQEVQVFTGRATGGAPLVASPGVLKVLRCRVLPGKEVQVGDHVVLVAEVLSILSPPPTSRRQEEVQGLNYMRSSKEDVGQQGDENVHGLVYVDGRYREVGGTIDVVESVTEQTQEKQLSRPDQGREAVHRTLGMNVRRGDEHMR